MERYGKVVCILLSVAVLLSFAPSANAAQVGDSWIMAQGAFVMDFETGLEIYSHNGDEVRVPASMTKVMSLYIMFEALANDEIEYDTVVPISERVYYLSRNTAYFNTVPLHYSETYMVEELLDLIVVYSASVVAVAELISGSEEAFLERMNAKASEMGADAYYVCCAGIGSNWVSPRAMATIA